MISLLLLAACGEPGDVRAAPSPADDTGADSADPGTDSDSAEDTATDSSAETGADSGADTGTDPDEDPDDAPARYPADQLQSPITPSVRDRLAALVAEGGDPLVFMKVGDSITADPFALGCFADSGVRYGERDELERTVEHFLAGEAGSYTPWDRVSRAAEVGETAAWALSGDPSPLERELDALDPAFAVVQFGTNDMQMGSTYRSALWPFAEDLLDLVDAILDASVVPLLVTVPPRLDDAEADEWVPNYNATIRGIAQARQVPLVDLELGLRELDGYGLYGDGVHLEPYSGGACVLNDTGLAYGCNLRNLLVLDGLDRLRRAALEGIAPDDPGAPLAGAGVADDPFVIDDLPFTDLRDTRRDGEAAVDAWSGCSDADESGNEVVYRLELGRTTTVRAMVFDRGDVDVDIHLVGAEPRPGECVERDDTDVKATLDAGTWHLVVDTYVRDGDEKAGEYLLVVVKE